MKPLLRYAGSETTYKEIVVLQEVGLFTLQITQRVPSGTVLNVDYNQACVRRRADYAAANSAETQVGIILPDPVHEGPIARCICSSAAVCVTSPTDTPT
jgi:hypothetical protein